MWLVSHLDRGNIANAKIVGMDKDLHLTGTQYNAALVIFFISYILFGKSVRTNMDSLIPCPGV